jgi:Xaa-Pro aminopeptidase
MMEGMTTPDFSERLTSLRREISTAGFDGFIVPQADEYQSEDIPPCAQRVAFLSGFTGSAAMIVVLKDKAAFFTDGRYALQAAQQVPKALFALFDTEKKSPGVWLEENAAKGSKIAYDPWLHANEEIECLKKALAKIPAEAIPIPRNLVDMIWKDRPAPPAAPVHPYDLAYAGKTSAEKRREIAAMLKKKGNATVVITDAAEVAWLLNVRGGDVAHTPLPLSRAILNDDATAEWFVDSRKVTETLPLHLGKQVSILPPEDFPAALDRLARAGKPVSVDPAHAPGWITDYLRAAQVQIDYGDNPCATARAIKNAVELNGMRAAHCRDGAALTNFLAWLNRHWGKDRVTELDAMRKLAAFREANIHYCGPSFDTISAAGEHGAIVHYRATEESNAPLVLGQLYLCDSGGQYLDGTTDVTRTVALGEPSAEMRENFTRVLKGHIALATIRFPEGTTGADLDVLARQYLWRAGRDYGHGTGHGVGCYLSVHEGPQGISKRNKTPLKAGMIISNEPGYYKAGAYGIRIENLQTVIEIIGTPNADRKVFGFDTLTLAPIDLRLVDVSMLTEAESTWLNVYHMRVRQALRGIVDDAAGPWLESATKPLEK